MSPKLTSKKRLELIKRALSGEPISDICQENKISRVIFYKWIKRFKENGEQGLEPYKREYKKSKKTSVKSIKQYPSLNEAARLRMVCEVIKENTPLRIVAERNKVSKVTLYKWIKRYQQAGESKKALKSKTRVVKRYFRQTPKVYETALLNLIVQHPEYGIRRLVAFLPKIGRRPVIGHHGVQNTLKRYQLLSFEKRLSYSQSQRTAIVRLIENVLETVRSFFVMPVELRHRAIRFGLTTFLSAFAAIGVIGLIGLTGRSWLAVSGVNRLGMGFALTALLMGSVFFLYSLKYYLTVAIVLSYSQREGETGTNNRGLLKFKGSHWLTWLLGALGGNGNGNGKNGQKGPVGLEPDLGKIELERHPKIAIHIPFYNEKKVVERAIEAAISLNYPNYEVVLVDDSTDETTDIIRNIQQEFLGKGEQLKTTNGKGYTLTEVEVKQGVVLKHIHRTSRLGFKGGALGLALKLTDRSVEFISVFDADFVPYPDTLELFLKYFKAQNEMKEDYAHSNVAAVQGYQWHVLNKSENWITRGVRSEYSGSYVIERSGIEIYGGLKQISGSVYMIRRDVLQQVGWGESITEDFELTLKLYAQGYRVVYTPYIQAPAECVSTLKRLIRQRMRWAEGHSQNIRHMFKKLLTNPRLTTAEKLEFVYLSPYYLQAGFFLIGTLCWLIAETVFPARLPFWTSLWGWSLVLTNMLSLPLMNAVGLFLEESEEKDYLGLASFLALSYILVPFQAYAAVKGFLEEKEGPWFRTPKTGKITDIFTRGKFYRFIQGIIPGKQPAYSSPSQYLALATANGQFSNFKIRRRHVRWAANTTLALLVSLTTLLTSLAPFLPMAQNPVLASPGRLVTVEDVIKGQAQVGTEETKEIDNPPAFRFTSDSGEGIDIIFHQEPRVRIKVGQKEMEISTLEIEGIGKVHPRRGVVVGQREVRYEEVVPGIDLVYKFSRKGVEEEFVIKKNLPIKGIVQRVSLKEVRVIGPTADTFGFFDENDKEVFQFKSPFMYEKDNKDVQERSITMKLEKDTLDYKLTKRLNSQASDWLSSPQRIFPVILDPSVIVLAGVSEGEVAYGGNQRKLVYSTTSSKWYAVREDDVDATPDNLGDIVFYTSSDGTSWSGATDMDSTDCTLQESNPSIWQEGALLYVVWNTRNCGGSTGTDDSLVYRTINTASADALGTRCSTADLGVIAGTDQNSIAVVGTNVFMVNDNDPDFMRGTTTCGAAAAVATGHGVTAGDRPVLIEFSGTLQVFFQDGQLSWSRCADGVCDAAGDWTPANQTINATTNTVFSVTTNDTNIWLLALSDSTAAVLYTCAGSCDALADWGAPTPLTTPFTGLTNLTAVSITYDTINADLYAHAIYETNEIAYFRKADNPTAPSWDGPWDYGWSGSGDYLGHISSPMTVTASSQVGVVLRQTANYEFATVPEKTLILLLLTPFLPGILGKLKRKRQ